MGDYFCIATLILTLKSSIIIMWNCFGLYQFFFYPKKVDQWSTAELQRLFITHFINISLHLIFSDKTLWLIMQLYSLQQNKKVNPRHVVTSSQLTQGYPCFFPPASHAKKTGQWKEQETEPERGVTHRKGTASWILNCADRSVGLFSQWPSPKIKIKS